jgi:nitrite reductase/ring-hydroxylating ferredoxin subunit/uncharacterized membrane protein
MASEELVAAVADREALDAASEALQPAVVGAFESAGEAGRVVKNALHGTWLGHPLHPALTDVPIGAWTVALTLDAVEAMSGREGAGSGADAAIAIGLAGAVGAAVTGLTDWSATDGRARNVGLVHGVLNVGATALYATSLALRRGSHRRAGVGLSMLGFAVASASAWLGGHLVYGERIGVDHAATDDAPHEFVPVIAETEVAEGALVRAEANGVRVLLVRRGDEVLAIAETCSHLGGPLAEGTIEGDAVRCPWHGSRFSLEDGHVVDGPATFPQPCFETRVRNGRIEVRASRRGANGA